jgi:MYXO-CTERM domain-containing protein
MILRMICVLTAAIGMLCAPVSGSVTVYANNKSAWQAAAQQFSTITFTDYPAGTHITNQYRDEFGVAFVGWQFIHHSPSLFPNDDYGLRTAQHPMRILFDEPHYTFAIDHPSRYVLGFFHAGELFYTSPIMGNANPGFFSGFISTLPFDEVIISYYPFPNTSTFIDDLHFGTLVPMPGALALFGLGALALRRRRRLE